MKSYILTAAALCALISPIHAQETEAPAPSPNQIVDAAEAEDWVSIPAEDLLVMTLAPASDGTPREVVIQLMPPPFSQGWVHNIKLLAREGWYDGISVNRVQDNYVVQWGDPNYDNPESDGANKVLPDGLKVMGERCYTSDFTADICDDTKDNLSIEQMTADAAVAMAEAAMDAASQSDRREEIPFDIVGTRSEKFPEGWRERDPYTGWVEFYRGWPVAGTQGEEEFEFWPTHCYGMVGVGRNYSPDTGSGAELYTVIGHAPRHLDRNIALVGRIIEGMEHLSSLPRGKGTLGFYADFEKDKRTPILSIRVASDIEDKDFNFEYLSTESETFARYAEARANRRDPFFIVPAGGADICNIPVPVRRVASD
ncbi:peptidylprolyl isomerase [Erythrobacter sp. HA6-11]